MPTPGKPILPPWILWAALITGMLLALYGNLRHGLSPDPISDENLRHQYERRVL